MQMEVFLMQLLNGISGGMLLFLLSAGLTIIFGTLKVLNMAHGAFYMLGAYLCFMLTSTFTRIPGVFWWTLFAAPIIVAAIGGIVEVLLLRRIYNRDILDQYIITFALILIIGDLCRLIWGVELHVVSTPWPFNTSVNVFGHPYSMYNFFLMFSGVISFIALLLLINGTRLGVVIRAVIHNRDMTNALGINVPLVYTGVFMLGCGFAGIGGTLVAPMLAVSPGMDMHILIECFIIVVIGGIGSLPGAFVSSLILGLVNAFGILVFPRLAIAFGFLLMIIVLIVRPSGLFGRPER